MSFWLGRMLESYEILEPQRSGREIGLVLRVTSIYMNRLWMNCGKRRIPVKHRV